MSQQADFSDQSILVTGAARGLGRSMAARLAACGARVGLIDVDEAGCREAADEVRGRGGRAEHFAIDVSQRAGLLAAADAFARGTGRIDAVINNAMLLRYEPVEQVTEEVLARMTGIGIHGSFWGAQA